MVPNLYYGALRPLDAPSGKFFYTKIEYFGISNYVFNFNFLALVIFEILGVSQIYIREAYAPLTPPSGEFSLR